MENRILNTLWQQQASTPPLAPQDLIKKAIAQKRNQNIGIAVMSLTVGIIIAYAIWQFPEEINSFIVGLFLMISSMLVRIAVEIASRWRRVAGAIHLDGRQYLASLKNFYNWRKRIHYILTPICFGTYLIGLWLLFPYFKEAFSLGFYIYLIVSAVISLTVVAFIIVRQIKKEVLFLAELAK